MLRLNPKTLLEEGNNSSFLRSKIVFHAETKHGNFQIYLCIQNCNCHNTRIHWFLEK